MLVPSVPITSVSRFFSNKVVMRETQTTVPEMRLLSPARMLRQLALTDLKAAGDETAWNGLGRARNIFQAHDAWPTQAGQ